MTKAVNHYDVIIIGGGAAGLFCAFTAGQRGLSVLVLDSSNKVGKKILMSGGGRCNFTNLDIQPHNYLSANPHFCKSALSGYNQWHFIALVQNEITQQNSTPKMQSKGQTPKNALNKRRRRTKTNAQEK